MTHNLRARLVYVSECLEDGDYTTATAIVLDLLAEIGVETGGARCRWCGLKGWPGEVVRHEHIVHPHELLDLEAA